MSQIRTGEIRIITYYKPTPTIIPSEPSALLFMIMREMKELSPLQTLEWHRTAQELWWVADGMLLHGMEQEPLKGSQAAREWAEGEMGTLEKKHQTGAATKHCESRGKTEEKKLEIKSWDEELCKIHLKFAARASQVCMNFGSHPVGYQKVPGCGQGWVIPLWGHWWHYVFWEWELSNKPRKGSFLSICEYPSFPAEWEK